MWAAFAGMFWVAVLALEGQTETATRVAFALGIVYFLLYFVSYLEFVREKYDRRQLLETIGLRDPRDPDEMIDEVVEQ